MSRRRKRTVSPAPPPTPADRIMAYVNERLMLSNTDLQYIAGLNGRMLYASDIIALVDDSERMMDLLEATGVHFIPTAAVDHRTPKRLAAEQEEAEARVRAALRRDAAQLDAAKHKSPPRPKVPPARAAPLRKP